MSKANQRRGHDYGLSDVLSVVCRLYGITCEQLKAPGKARPCAEARALAALFVRESPGLSLTELGKMLNRDIAPLGRAGQRLLVAALEDEGLISRINDLRLELSKWQKG